MYVRLQHRASLLLLLLAVARVADVAAERSVAVASMRAAQLERLVQEQLQEAASVFAGLEEDLRAHHHSKKRARTVNHHHHSTGGRRGGGGSAIAVDSRGHHRRHAFSPFDIAGHVAGHIANVARHVVGTGEETKEKSVCCWEWKAHEGKIELHEYAATSNATAECEFLSDDECSQVWVQTAAEEYAAALANASEVHNAAKTLAHDTQRDEVAAAKAAKEAAEAAARGDESAEKGRAELLREEAERKAASETEAAKTSSDATQKQAEATRESEKEEAQAAYDAAIAAAQEKEIAEKQRAQASYEAAMAKAAKDMEAAREQAEKLSKSAASARADGEDDAAKAYEAAEKAAQEKMMASMSAAKDVHRAAKAQAKADVEAAIDRNRRSMQKRGGAGGLKCSDLQEAYEAKKERLLKEVRQIEERQNASHPSGPSQLGLVAAGRLGRAFLGVTKAEEAAKGADPEGSCGITASDREELKSGMQGLHPCWPKVLEACDGRQGGSEEAKQEAFVRLTSLMLSCKEPSEEDLEEGKKAIEAQQGASEQAAQVEAEDLQAKAEAADAQELELAEGDEGTDEADEAVGSLLEQGTSSTGGSAAMAAAGSGMLARAEAQVEGAVSRLGQLLDSGADTEAESLARALLAGQSGDGFEIFGLILGGIVYTFALAAVGGAAVVWFLLGWMVCILYKALSFLVNIVRQLFSWSSRPTSSSTSSSSIWGCYKGGFQSLSSWGEKSHCILMLTR